jgi:hypothetical protein
MLDHRTVEFATQDLAVASGRNPSPEGWAGTSAIVSLVPSKVMARTLRV